MDKRGIIAGIFLLGSIFLQAQNFNKNDFYEADMALVSQNYERAQRIFERLLKTDPDNVNLNYLNGLCLIKIPGRKKESLPFLEKAAPSISSDYKYGDPQEMNAPYETLKYYALAKKLNEDIPGAIELFTRYKTLLGSKDEDEIAYADAMIKSCHEARELMKSPVSYISHNLGDNLTSEDTQLYPVVNSTETLLFYVQRNKYQKDDIFFTEKVNGVWNKPVKITIQLGVKGESYPSSVSFDNERLYLTVKTGVSTDIYYSVFQKGRWQKAIKMSKPVNSKSWDSHAYESSDGNYLYFSSDRKGGFGNMDLYRSQKDEKGEWTKPVNLGETINTSKNELMPAISADNSKLYFKSEGFKNIGGYDIFVSEKLNDNEWNTPVNIGYPINTPDDDIYFMPVGDGNFAYVSTENPSDNYRNELVLIEILPGRYTTNFSIAGHITLPEFTDSYEDIRIEVYNTENYRQVLTTQPDLSTGNYVFEIENGSYMINYSKPGYELSTKLFDLLPGETENNLVLDVNLVKETPVAEAIPEFVEPPAEEENLYTETTEVIQEPEIETTEVVVTEVYDIPVPEMDQKVEYAYAEPEETPAETQEGKLYTIQIMASLKKLDMTSFPENLDVEMQKGNDNYYRYITGMYPSVPDALKTLNATIKPLFNDAFIRPYILDSYMSYAYESSSMEYTIQLMALKKEINTSYFNNISQVKISYGSDGYYRYSTGEFASLTEARQELKNIVENGYSGAFIKKTSEISNY